jgi:probable F420-dependent oxidoreductase
LQCNPPASRLVELTVRAENRGFTHAWTFDSHVLWQEPFVVYSQMLAATRNIIVGPMVTNPLTRDWTVTASAFATLNGMFGNRTVCGIGRGDSAVRVQSGVPSTLRTLREGVTVIRDLANGRVAEVNGTRLQLPWASRSRLGVWVAGYGPKALELAGRYCDGFILQLADPVIAKWTIERVRNAAADAGRDPRDVTICAAAPAYLGGDRDRQREQCRWFGAMVGNHVSDLVTRYGAGGDVPRDLTDYIAGRVSYDYNEHGRAGNTHTAFVPDEIVDRFCVLGDTGDHVARLSELRALGVDQFACYLQHDGIDQTLAGYGDTVITELAPAPQAILN